MYKIYIDFETRSECDLTKCGAWIYSKHPTTEILCLAYIITEDKEILKSGVIDDFGDTIFKRFFHKHINKIQLIAHYAFFEQSIFYNILVSKYDWSSISSIQWRCTMAKALAHSLPKSLDILSTELDLEHKKDKAGHNLMMKMSKPRKPTKEDSSKWLEKPEDLARLKQYCLDDTKAEYDLDIQLRDLSPIEQKIWLLDQKINLRGLYIDIDLVKKAMELIKYYLDPLEIEIKSITKGKVLSSTKTKELKKWCNENSSALLKSLSKDSLPIYLIENENILSDDVKRVLNIRLEAAATSTAKFFAIYKYIDTDNRVRGSLQYHGASTGRWTGAGIQPQNLPKGITGLDTDAVIKEIKLSNCNIYDFSFNIEGDPMSLLKSCIRGCIIAPDNKIIVCGDYASIEPRVLFWLCQQLDALEMFRNKEDIYCYMASDIFNRVITKNDKDERFLGKTAILGLGYGMGKDKFKASCENYGVSVDIELAEKAVKTYRKKFLKVIQFWREIQNAAMNAIKTGKPYDVGSIRYKKIGNFLYCRLPSGRLLSYFKPQIITAQTPYGFSDQIQYKGSDPVTKKFKIQKTYGGKLVENICQAVARDMMAQAMLNLDEMGYEIILTVHDEIVCEVEKDSDKSLKEFLEILATPPIWAKDCPLAVEGWEGDRYHK